jgi:hypothetical protein
MHAQAHLTHSFSHTIEKSTIVETEKSVHRTARKRNTSDNTVEYQPHNQSDVNHFIRKRSTVLLPNN